VGGCPEPCLPRALRDGGGSALHGCVTLGQWERGGRTLRSPNKRAVCVGLGFEKHLVVLQVSELLTRPFLGSVGV